MGCYVSRSILTLCASLLVVPVLVQARELHVDNDAPADFKTIQAAVDAAADGDVIIIDPGTYSGPGNCDIDLRGKAISIQSLDPQDPSVVETTVIDCVGTLKEPHRAFSVVGCAGAVLSGLTITHGLADAGGAVLCQDSVLDVTNCRILDNAALDGGADSDPNGSPGGGLYCQNSSVSIAGCLIRGNRAGDGTLARDLAGGDGGDGGGICSVRSELTISASFICANAAGSGGDGGRGGRGGGIYAETVVIDRCIIEANRAGAAGDVRLGLKGASGQGGAGGGIHATSVEITNSLVVGNRAGRGYAVGPLGWILHGDGGGIWSLTGAVRHCTIAGNMVYWSDPDGVAGVEVSTSRGAGIFCLPDTVISNSIIYSNTPDQLVGDDCDSVTYCDIEGLTCADGTGNIIAAPGFVRPGHWATSNDPSVVVYPEDPRATWVSGDYHLTAVSPCLDGGDPQYVPGAEETDLDGHPRRADAAVEIGAYEFWSIVPVYRFWSPKTGKHFFTPSETEKDKLVREHADTWSFEGTAYYAYAWQSEPNLLPVHRFWSQKLSAHFWTISEQERDKLLEEFSVVWMYAGPSFFAFADGRQPTGARPVYRFWSDQLLAHFYTISESEKDKLVDKFADVWSFEGPAWYAYEQPPAVDDPCTPDGPLYEFSGGAGEAVYVVRLAARVDGRDVKIDNQELAFVPQAGRMLLAVDLDAMTTTLHEFHIDSQPLEHTVTVSPDDRGGAPISVVLSVSGAFDALAARGPYEIDPQSLVFPTRQSQELGGARDVYAVTGSAAVAGRPVDLRWGAGATDFVTAGRGTFDDSTWPDGLEASLAGTFTWSRQQREDLLLETTVDGHRLQLYVTSAQVRAVGLWHGTRRSAK